ncbi:MAG: MFS transporter [Fimbriimonadales bacterium]
MQDASKNGSGGIWKVIWASSAGTMIEWYDFYIFGILAVTLSTAFFPESSKGLMQTLGIFAAGFIVRPFGAIFFGRIGDVIGRKYTFLLTLVLMGGSTCGIGLLPTYATAGFVAPLLLLALRLIQGLALGGEYGGAATYIAEHAPDGRRGFYTSFIQTTATLGLFVALGVLLGVRSALKESEFADWGWRIPFLLSAVLVVFSYAIRRKMAESPLFARLKAEGKTSVNPIKESFGNPVNRKLVLLALFGATAGQGVVWYTGQFYALYYLQTVLHVSMTSSYFVMAIALMLGTPFFIVFGSLSDRIGRKKIIVTGCIVAALLYVPIYAGMVHATDIKTFNTGGAAPFVKVDHQTDPKTGDSLTVTTTITDSEEGRVTEKDTDRIPAKPGAAKPKVDHKTEITLGGPIMFVLSLLILLQVLFVTMVYGPIAAFLVELFPTRIRYTSMSLPYHIGNGVFGGLVPLIGKSLEGSIDPHYGGLAYPIGIALMTAFIGGFFIHEKRDVKLWDEPPDLAPPDLPDRSDLKSQPD